MLLCWIDEIDKATTSEWMMRRKGAARLELGSGTLQFKLGGQSVRWVLGLVLVVVVVVVVVPLFR